MDWASMVTVGRIVRPQHNRGHVVVAPDTDFAAERFAPGGTVYRVPEGAEPSAEPEALTIVAAREHDGRWVVGFEGVASINDAERLRGVELRVPLEALQPLGDDTFWIHDLVGCEVRSPQGVVGAVVRVDGGTGVPLLVVEGSDEVLVPFSAAICRRVDVRGRVIEIDPPAGLIELNRRSGA